MTAPSTSTTALQLSTINNVKIYSCNTGKSIPEWYRDFMNKKTGGKLKYNKQYRNRIELIQDFRFNTASTSICETPDYTHISVTGVYKPCIKLYDSQQLALKWERYCDSEILAQKYLDTDYRKLALLRTDRTIELHAAYGKHSTVRIPKYGRSIEYNKYNCDLITTSASNEIYRLNLDIGQFLQPITVDSPYVETINNAIINPVHPMLMCGSGGALGYSDRADISPDDMKQDISSTIRPTLMCYDTRNRAHIGTVDLIDSLNNTEYSSVQHEWQNSSDTQVTSLEYASDGLTCGVGTSNGIVILYDIRSNKPLTVYESHRYEQPIKSIKFHHTNTKHVISTDARQIRVWNQDTGAQFTTIESGTSINDLCVSYGNSGVLLCANESSPISIYYIPQLGIAPKWCRFLDNLTEEMDESIVQNSSNNTIYDDYKFITRDECELLNIDTMMNTALLRPYMHGYFIKLQLYNKIKSVQEPDTYDTYMKNKIQRKIADKVNTRTVVKQNNKQVNTQYADALHDTITSNSINANPLNDDRFSKLFNADEFAIDTTSVEYQRVNPFAKIQQSSSDHVNSNKRNEDIRFDKSSLNVKSADTKQRRHHNDDSSDDDQLNEIDQRKRHKLAIAHINDKPDKPVLKISTQINIDNSDEEEAIGTDRPNQLHHKQHKSNSKHNTSNNDSLANTNNQSHTTPHMSLAERLAYDQQQLEQMMKQRELDAIQQKKSDRQPFKITGKAEMKPSKHKYPSKYKQKR